MSLFIGIYRQRFKTLVMISVNKRYVRKVSLKLRFLVVFQTRIDECSRGFS